MVRGGTPLALGNCWVTQPCLRIFRYLSPFVSLLRFRRIAVAIPASLLAAGYARHDNYQVNTAPLAGLAYADCATIDLAIRAVTRREPLQTPRASPPLSGTFFAGGVSPFKGSSFPSGHASGAFSVATVIATCYRHHRCVPFLAFGFATAVSLSRVSTRSHFPSDVFLGAALGYTVTRYQTLRLE